MGREIYLIPPILRLVPIRNIRNDQSYDGRIYLYEHTPIHSKSIKKLWMRDSARSSAKGSDFLMSYPRKAVLSKGKSTPRAKVYASLGVDFRYEFLPWELPSIKKD